MEDTFALFKAADKAGSAISTPALKRGSGLQHKIHN